jgi:hypothetical protein
MQPESDLNGIRDRLQEIASQMRHDIETTLDESELRSRLYHYRQQLIIEGCVLTAAIAIAGKTLTLEQVN